MKKTVAASLLLLGAVTAPVAAAQNTDLSGEITVTAWDVAAEALQGVVAGFNEEYPNVQVTVENLGNQQVYDRGLAGCAAGGADLPDVYAVENNEAEVFWNRFPGCFTDLNTLGAADLRDQFPDFKWTELMLGEQVFAVPWDSGPVVTFYRRDLYEEAGISSDDIETWDDFIAAGQQLDEATGAKMLWFDFSDDGVWRELANQNGCFYFDDAGESITVNQPGCVSAMETMKKLYDAGVVEIVDWNGAIQAIKNNTLAGCGLRRLVRRHDSEQRPRAGGQLGRLPNAGERSRRRARGQPGRLSLSGPGLVGQSRSGDGVHHLRAGDHAGPGRDAGKLRSGTLVPAGAGRPLYPGRRPLLGRPGHLAGHPGDPR